MPNITAKSNSKCGNDKCGTFATDHHMHPHGAGKVVLPGRATHKAGGHPHPSSAKAHLHGGHSMPMGGGKAMRNDHDADDR